MTRLSDRSTSLALLVMVGCLAACGHEPSPPPVATPLPATPAAAAQLTPEQATTVQALRSIGEAIERRYQSAGGDYAFATTIDGIADALESGYLVSCPRTDGWGNPLVVDAGEGWLEIRSLGADGRRDELSQGGPSDDPNADIVWGEGFTQYPRGMEP